MVQANDVVNLRTYFDEWSRCVGSGYQKDHLYRFGKFDTCSPQWQDIKTAFRAKSSNDPAEAKALIESTHYKQNLGSDPACSPTSGVIWELKETPGWD
mmetsp:Transcript_8063/g.9727  ORF Transcript_8063/g.9727 Transcript_8063/m.9727 type:complete len:98 (+) Transcript_8063:172-465(+)